LNKDVIEKGGVNPTVTILSLQETALNRLLSNNTMGKMLLAEAQNGAAAYTLADLLGDLKATIFTELTTKKPIDIYRRNLQKSYIERVNTLINPPAPTGITFTFGGGGTQLVDVRKSDVLSYLKGNLRELKSAADAAAATATDKGTKYHLQDISDRISKILNPKS